MDNNIEFAEQKLIGCSVGDGQGPCVRGCSGWNRHLNTLVLTRAAKTGNLSVLLRRPNLCDILDERINKFLNSITK